MTLTLSGDPFNFPQKYIFNIQQVSSISRLIRQIHKGIRKSHIVINHLENIKGICTKTGLIKSLRMFYKTAVEPQAAHYTLHDTTATTFVVLSDCLDAEYSAFVQRFQELSRHNYKKEKIPAKHCEENIWLIKPAAMNQGRGSKFLKIIWLI